MLKKYFVITLIGGLLNLFLAATAFAGTSEEKKAAVAEKVRAGIVRLKTGPEAKIELKLYDNTKIKGYVSSADEGHLVVVDEKTGSAIEVPYPLVKQVKGNNLSEGVKIAIGIGLILALVIIIASQTK